MCNYQNICQEKEHYGISIMQPYGGPATLICKNCSLSPEKYWIDDSKQGRHITRMRNKYRMEYNHYAGCYCVVAGDYNSMICHVKEHIGAGENIHPSVLKILELNKNNCNWRIDYLATLIYDRDIAIGLSHEEAAKVFRNHRDIRVQDYTNW